MTRQEYLNRPLIKDVITMDKLIENICSACHCGKCKADSCKYSRCISRGLYYNSQSKRTEGKKSCIWTYAS